MKIIELVFEFNQYGKKFWGLILRGKAKVQSLKYNKL